MPYLKIANRAASALASGVTDVATTWTVTTGEGAKFPATGDFHLTCENEIAKCTARTNDAFTVVRAQEGTTAAAHIISKAVELRITAGVLDSRDTWTADKLKKGAGAGVDPTEIDVPDVPAHTADLDAHIKDMLEITKIGQYYWHIPQLPLAGVTLVANQLYACPLLVARPMTIDRLLINVLTAGAGGTAARLGIYNDGGSLAPGTLLLDAGAVSVATTGLKTVTISQALLRGFYWLTVVSDGAPQIYGVHRNSSGTFLGINPTDPTRHNMGYYVAFTYAALPDPFPSSPTLDVNYFPTPIPRVLSLD